MGVKVTAAPTEGGLKFLNQGHISTQDLSTQVQLRGCYSAPLGSQVLLGLQCTSL